MKRPLLMTALLLPGMALAQSQVEAGASAPLYAGPGEDYPFLENIVAGEPLGLYGCTDGYLWCDVQTPGNRGWVAGGALAFDQGGQTVYLQDNPGYYAVPVIAFSIGTYWGAHYSNRSWYNQWGRYQHYGPPRPPRYPPHHNPGPPGGPGWSGGGRPPNWDHHPGNAPGHNPGYGPGRPSASNPGNFNPGHDSNFPHHRPPNGGSNHGGINVTPTPRPGNFSNTQTRPGFRPIIQNAPQHPGPAAGNPPPGSPSPGQGPRPGSGQGGGNHGNPGGHSGNPGGRPGQDR